ncbi:MAG: hypothetical protein V4733_07495 [Verrucomicrobiota bacterium]
MATDCGTSRSEPFSYQDEKGKAGYYIISVEAGNEAVARHVFSRIRVVE